MARHRVRSMWWHTAALLAMTANVHRDHKKRRKAYTAADFMGPLLPARERSGGNGMPVPSGRVNIRDLKGMFLRMGVKEG